MRLEADLNLRSVKALMAPFIAIAGIRAWEKRWAALDTRMRQQPILAHSLSRRYSLELTIRELRRRSRSTGRWLKRIDTQAEYEALSLVANAFRIHRRSSSTGRKRLAGAIRDALRSDRGFLSLAFELSTAVDLMMKGFEVEFVDLEGLARYDFLVSKDGVNAEVECKTASYDLGRKIHRKHFEGLAASLTPALTKILKAERKWSVLLVELEDRMPSREALQAEIVAASEQILTPDGGTMSLSLGDVRTAQVELPPALSEDSLRDLAQEVSGSQHFHNVLLADHENHWLMVVAYSKRPDDPLRALNKQLREAARQLEGEHPGLLFSYVDEVAPHEWESLASGTDLAAMTTQLLAAPQRSHIHSVAYASYGQMFRRQNGSVGQEGPQLVFRNPGHHEHENPELDLAATGRSA